jgi:hypothetical protein
LKEAGSTVTQSEAESAEQFVDWIHERVVRAGRGDGHDRLAEDPKGTFWLGRLASEETVQQSALGARGGRLDPCAIDIRVKPASSDGPWQADVRVKLRTWSKHDNQWVKDGHVDVPLHIDIGADEESRTFGQTDLQAAMQAAGGTGRRVELRVEVERWQGSTELIFSLVNTSPLAGPQLLDTHVYESGFEVTGIATTPFQLESLPDSFRYDRRVPAIGRNCGIQEIDGGFRTADFVVAERNRSLWWDRDTPEPDLRFATLARDPLPPLRQLVDDVVEWGQQNWSTEALAERAHVDGWSEGMSTEAADAAQLWLREVARLQYGLRLLESQDDLATAFKLANRAIQHAAAGKYDGWRPFQIGFLLSSLNALVDPSESATVDVVWFATGGGKTETYLGLLCTAILYDRMTGKHQGITAWSRFPLRMLSLQQTQRFADALAGAELMRQENNLGGDPIALGFFVGQAGTPNKIALDPQDGLPDPNDPDMPRKYQVLLHCPFCKSSDLAMDFDRASWTLRHRCMNDDCLWADDALPFYVVDQEIYRFLPSVVVGTLDKAALLGMQAAMRGFVGPPMGICDRAGHGFCYASRKATPSGCLVPGCRGKRLALVQERRLWAPRLRLQDELHLLRDSLGAVDAHYEALMDHLQDRLGAQRAKVVASSATLTGYERQIDVLYQRDARVFPQPGPAEGRSFWSKEGTALARRYVAIAPRGVTTEFVSDRTLATMQQCVRELVAEPERVCAEAGIDLRHADFLVSNYGVDVVYGNTVRDVDAARRSLDTQLGFDVNAATLTGQTPFDEVRTVLDRLDHPESVFGDRIHVVAASSMMSHGVDIDRLNLMVMHGVPLTTAEFIQTTARVGRKFPGLVYVLHRIAREREAATFVQFEKFVRQGDRFVEPIPITRRSRRVLRVTIPGIVEARRLAIHEPQSGGALSMVATLRAYADSAGLSYQSEFDEIADALGLTGELDELARDDLMSWLKTYFTVLRDPATTVRWPSDLSPSGGVMRSLRDVEESAPVTEGI